jgi:hypothetical protein
VKWREVNGGSRALVAHGGCRGRYRYRGSIILVEWCLVLQHDVAFGEEECAAARNVAGSTSTLVLGCASGLERWKV